MSEKKALLDQNFIPDSFLSKESDFERPGAETKRYCFLFSLLFYTYGLVLLKFSHDNGYLETEIELEEGYLKELLEVSEWFVTSNWYYLAFFPVINIILIYIVGHYMLTGILYPYQNSIGRETLDRNNATKFGEEFEHYLESFAYTLRVQAGQDVKKLLSEYNQSRKQGGSSDKRSVS